MAIPATQVWEVRPTNGTANAGGGFDPSVASPGTDYSQQDAVQVAYTDLVIGGTTTNLTSAGTPFTSAHVGNTIAITGGTGFTTGFYSIRSVAAAVATMDRSVGTGGSTGGTGNLGGARSGYSVGTTTLQSSLVAGNKVWIKNEAWNEAVALTIGGAAATPIIHEGYDTSRGDKPTGTGRPLNNRASAAGDGITISQLYNRFLYLRVTAAGDAGFSIQQSLNAFIYCRSYGNTGEGFEGTGAFTTHMFGCEIDTNSNYGATNWVPFGSCNYWHDNTLGGFSKAGNGGTHIFSIFEANAGNGIDSGGGSSPMNIQNCVFDGNTGASTDGVNGTNVPTSHWINNIFSNNGRRGVTVTDGDSIYSDYNCYYNNTTAAISPASGAAGAPNQPGTNDQVAVDPQFTNRGAGDFSIGTNLKALGFPGVFPGALSTGYMDIGAVQRQEAGGGGGLAANPLRGFL